MNMQITIEYLEHIIESDGVRPNSDLINAIQTYPRSIILKELQSFPWTSELLSQVC